ncbi:MAG: diaminopimelate epimerase [Alphaproteobacteria bacterium]|nr:MAG: diaminopimelate epimerase [Alphaproteobacteria bacterium]
MSQAPSAGSRSFVKMHGLGNDFVIFDARREPLLFSPEQVRLLADRRFGIGCDQVIVIEPAGPAHGDADLFLRFYNADGTESGACGNGSRCAAALAFAEAPRRRLAIATKGGRLVAESAANGAVSVDMGPPRLDWRDIPLARAMDTLHLPIAEGPLHDPVAVSMGNPHAVFFVADVAAVDLAAVGPALEAHPLFPERANISIVEIAAPDRLRLRVWERGAGLTLACGTAACAAVVAAARRGAAARTARVALPGGALEINWRESDDHVVMTGPVAVSFMGMTEVPVPAEALS